MLRWLRNFITACCRRRPDDRERKSMDEALMRARQLVSMLSGERVET